MTLDHRSEGIATADTVEPTGAVDSIAAPEEQSAEFRPEDIRHNMIFLVLLDAIALLGLTDTQMAMQPLLVHLNASNFVIGVFAAAFGLFIPGIILSPWITRRFRIKKWYLCVAHIPGVSMTGLIGLMVILSIRFDLSPQTLLLTILAMTLLGQLANGFAQLPHQEYVAACIPMTHRGRFSGISLSVGNGLVLLTSGIGFWILKHVPKPACFGYVIVMGWAIMQFGYMFSLFGREKPTPVEKSPKPWSKDMFQGIWNDVAFIRLLVVVNLAAVFSNCVFSFIPIYGFKQLHMPPETSAVIIMMGKVVGMVGGFSLGIAVDRLTAKRMYPIGILVLSMAVLPVIFIHHPYAVYSAVVLQSLGLTAASSALAALMYGLPKAENRPGYFAVFGLTTYMSNAIGFMFIGWLCDTIKFHGVFVYGFFVTIGYALMLWFYLNPKLPDKAEQYS